MTHDIVIIIALFLIYYNIGGLATTNILRLTKGNSLSIHSSKCICDNCGSKIPPLLQLPIISFLVCKGKCRSCRCSIPIYPLLLEIIIFLGMSFISLVFSFSMSGILLSFLYYELIRIVLVLIRGKREVDFKKQYLIAVFSMIPFLIPCLFVSALYCVNSIKIVTR